MDAWTRLCAGRSTLQAKIERLKSDRLQALLHQVLGSLHRQRGEFERARESLERALQIHGEDERATGTVVVILSMLASVYSDLGRHDDQLETSERAAAMAESLFGSDHPRTAIALVSYAGALGKRDRHMKALELYQRALEIRAASHGEHTDGVAQVHSNMAIEFAQLGETKNAEAHFLSAIDIRERLTGPDHIRAARTRFNLAYLYLNGAPAKAEAQFRRILPIYKMTYGSDHSRVAALHHHLGLAAERQQHVEDAIELFHTARTSFERKLGKGHPKVAMAWTSVGRVELQRGRAEQAVSALDRAQALYAAKGASPTELAKTRFILAQALWQAGQPGASQTACD